MIFDWKNSTTENHGHTSDPARSLFYCLLFPASLKFRGSRGIRFPKVRIESNCVLYLKEQLRDEEKARKEYEEKLRQAAKEEELKKKAVEAAEKKFKNATAEQKAHYEQELHKLRRELADATQQKLTIAQQTKKGQLTLDTLRFSVPDAPETDADDEEA